MTFGRLSNDNSALTKRERVVISSILTVAAFLTILDVYEDWIDGAPLSHIVPEIIIVFFSLGIALYLIQHMLRVRRDAFADIQHEIAEVKASAASWRLKAEGLSRGISDAISEQFNEWGLSQAEQEVSYLLLKGLSIQEIASIREITERTVRQQASSVYKKSGLAGRAQLSAFFMEDLFDIGLK